MLKCLKKGGFLFTPSSPLMTAEKEIMKSSSLSVRSVKETKQE